MRWGWINLKDLLKVAGCDTLVPYDCVGEEVLYAEINDSAHGKMGCRVHELYRRKPDFSRVRRG